MQEKPEPASDWTLSRGTLSAVAGRAVIFIAFAALTVLGILLAASIYTKTWTERPYEGWDEIATFNAARVLSGPNIDGEPTYGTIETFIQFVANEYYLFFDPIGRAKDQRVYSNNALPSLNDRYFVFHDKVLFHYFRGIDDHEPIFISRRIRVVALFVLVAMVAAGLWLSMGTQSLVFTVALLFLCAMPEMRYLDEWQSIPGPINAVLCFAIAVSLWAYARYTKPCFLYAAALCFALGVNLKMDIVIAGIMFPVAFFVACRERRFETSIRDALIAAAMFAACLLVTDPWLVISPTHEVQNKLRLLFSTTNTTSAWSLIAKNWPSFARYIHEQFLPAKLWIFVPPLLVIVAACALPLALALMMPIRRGLLSLCVPLSGIIALWLIPLCKASVIYNRYFYNGMAAWLTLMATIVVFAWNSNKRYARMAAAALVLIGLTTTILDIRRGELHAAEVKDAIAKGDGFSVDQTRVRASQAIINLYKAGGFSDTVLVDQHAYIDLRQILLAGLKPHYINMLDFERRLAELDASQCYLVIFSHGNYRLPPEWPSYIKRWSPEQEHLYDAYLARLTAMPVLFDVPGKPQLVLAGQPPVDPDDHISVATTCRAPPPPASLPQGK